MKSEIFKRKIFFAKFELVVFWLVCCTVVLYTCVVQTITGRECQVGSAVTLTSVLLVKIKTLTDKIFKNHDVCLLLLNNGSGLVLHSPQLLWSWSWVTGRQYCLRGECSGGAQSWCCWGLVSGWWLSSLPTGSFTLLELVMRGVWCGVTVESGGNVISWTLRTWDSGTHMNWWLYRQSLLWYICLQSKNFSD